MAISDYMPKDPAWYARMAELEGDYEVGAGYESLTPEGSKRFIATIGAMAMLPIKDD